MTNVLIVYDTRSGNTEKMALAVAEGARQVKRVKADVKRVEDASLEDLCKADAIIMGSPTYYGQMSGKLKTFIDKSVRIHGRLQGKVGAAFTSSGSTASGAETTLLSMIQAMLVHGMIIQGRSANRHYGVAAVGAPDQEQEDLCKDLGRRVADLAAKLRK